MKFAYLVCFVALLQISSCQDDSSTQDLQTSTSTIVTITMTEQESNETSESEQTSEPTSSTTDNEVAVSENYKTVGSESTTTDLTTEESTEQSTTAKTGQGVLVYPTALVVLVPLCIRLATINLVGVV